MNRKIISLVIAICCLLTTPVMAQGNSIPTKDLLMIVEDSAVYDLSFINANSEMVWDIVSVSDYQNYNLDDYDEIAAPVSQSEKVAKQLIEQYEQGKKIYLYGELTINDFSNILALEQYGLENVLGIKNYSVEDSNFIRIYDLNHPVSALGKSLFISGIEITHLELCTDNLEDYFRKVTGGIGIA